MPRQPSAWRRLTTATRWPVGIAFTSWKYMWRTTPMHRTEEEGTLEADGPPPLPDGVSHEEVQRASDGAGPLFHRRYRTRIRNTDMSATDLIERVSSRPDWAVPTEFATFQKTVGEKDVMRVGDEFVVRMAAPWDGPVRVIEKQPDRFRLATLEDHLEAGQIEFRAFRDDDLLVFEIESWARSSTPVVDALYNRLRMAKEIQLHMWTSTLEGVVRVSGGRMTGGIDIHTRRVEARMNLDRRLAALRSLKVNYDPDAPHPPEDGWRVDDYCEPLPTESAGEPVDGGPFEVAQRLLREYKVADPRLVRAYYDHDAELEGRDMLLQLRFHGLFGLWSGCRVGPVVDERREEDGRPVRVWGWPYQTLEGHIEQGQMNWEVWKWLDSGEVRFRIHSYSRNAKTLNPILNLGFRLFGQRERRRYLQSACRRMARLTAAALA